MRLSREKKSSEVKDDGSKENKGAAKRSVLDSIPTFNFSGSLVLDSTPSPDVIALLQGSRGTALGGTPQVVGRSRTT